MTKPVGLNGTGGRRGVTRRRVLVGTAAAGAALAMPAIIARPAKAAAPLVFCMWGGSFTDTMVEAFLKPFTAETGIEVLPTVSPSIAKVRAQVQTGNIEWDLIIPLPGWDIEGAKLGVWEPMDYSIIDMSNTPANAKRPYTVGFAVFAGGPTWSTARDGSRDKHPETWAEFWDVKKFPGRRGLRTRAEEMLEVALLADGVPAKSLYPLDVDRAFKALDRIKPNVTNWIEATEQTINLIQSNDCDFTYAYHNRAFVARNSGLAIGYSPKQNVLQTLIASVVKGTTKKAEAMKLLAFILKPENQARFANLNAMVPVRADAIPKVKPEVSQFFPKLDDPENAWIDLDFWGAHTDEVERRYKEWLIT